MPEVVGTFSSAEAWQERSDRRPETGNCSLGGLAQECLELAEVHLDGIKIGRVLGQVAKCRASPLDCLADGRSFVNIDVVHDDDIAAPERGDQTLLDIGQEHLSVHGAVDHHRGGYFIMTQGGDERDRPPISAWGSPDQLDTSPTATIEPHHLGGDSSFIDKHQPSGIKHALLSDPASARPRHVGALLFRRPQAFF
jgi:hypothetical protein